MKVIIEKLRTGKECYEYSEMVEDYIKLTLSKELGISHGESTTGFDCSHDYVLGNKKIEQKISGNYLLAVEYAYEDDTPSGISVTSADHMLMINPGFDSKKGEVGKVRLIRVRDIRTIIANPKPFEDSCAYCNKKHKVFLKTYKGNEYGRGSKVAMIHPHMVFDLKIADVACIYDSPVSNKVIGYDFNKLIMDNHHHVRKSLTYWFYEKPESITQ